MCFLCRCHLCCCLGLLGFWFGVLLVLRRGLCFNHSFCYGCRYAIMHWCMHLLGWWIIIILSFVVVVQEVIHKLYSVIFFLVLELCLRKKVVSTKFFIYLYLWYVVLLYDDMKKLQYAKRTSWLTMIMLDLYVLFGTIVYILIAKRWKSYSKFAKWQVICLIYPLSIGFVLCFAGSFPERDFHFNWVWLTFINHAVFLGLCGYILVNRQILPFKC